MAGEQIRLLVIEDVPQVASHMRSLLNAQTQIKMLDVVTSGEKAVATVATAFSPLVTTSSILICVCALSSDRMCDATCGTSSITSNRICSPATPYLSQRPGACLMVRWLRR